MDSSFNSEDDLDLIKEIDLMSDITNDNNKKNASSKPINTNTISLNTPKTDNKKTSRKKRRSPTKVSLTPKLDLDALLGPSEIHQNNDNNDFLNLSPRSENLFSSPKESTSNSNTALSLLEDRITSYADKAFQKLKEDLVFELKLLFEDNFHIQNIIYTFLMSLLSDIRNQIRFSNESFEFTQFEMDFDLDVSSLNLPKNSKKDNFQIRPIIEQISDIKSTFTQIIKKAQINLNQEIQSRDTELSSNIQNKKAKQQYIEQLNQKDNAMEKKLLELTFSLELYEKYNALMKQKFEDLEINETLNQQKIDTKLTIQQNIDQIQDEITRLNLNQENKRIFMKMKQIVDEKNELQQTINVLHANAKCLFDFSRKALYNIPNFNNSQMNTQLYGFTAPYMPQQDVNERYALKYNSDDQKNNPKKRYIFPTVDDHAEKKSDFLYTQSDYPYMLNTMNYNMKIPNYI